MRELRGIGVLLVLAAALVLPVVANAAPPPNDNFANAAELTGRFVFVDGTNVDATEEAGEPDHGPNAGGASIWYRWTAPATGRATVATCGSAFDTLLAVYTGEAYPLAPVDSDEAPCGDNSSVAFDATAGTTYRIAVDGVDAATGDVSLSLSLAPANDDFANAEQLSGETGTVSGTTIGASMEDGELDHLGYAWNSVWFEWTAPSSGWATFETCGSAFDTVLAVYTGSDVTALSSVAGNDDACGLESRVHFQAVAGTVYRLALAGYDGETGDFTLAWNRTGPPPLMTGLPAITGVARDGETVSTSDGAWGGQAPFTYAYAWGRCDRDECNYIPGATSRSYTIRSIDVGFRLFARVTASNAFGSAAAFSDTTGVIVARPPANTTAPTVSGEAKPGGLLVASGGDWSGTTPLSLAYQWVACNAAGFNCTNLAGQTGQVMLLSSRDVGSRIRVIVTATNSVGSASVPSGLTPVVRATPTRRCVVPKVRGKSLRAARAAIRRAHCRVGRVRTTFSARMKAGRVVSQTPRAGARLAVGARVHLMVSKGKRR
jgi:PASTA domain